MPSQQRILLFESHMVGIMSGKREDNLQEIQALLGQGWRGVMMSATSSPSVSSGA